MLYIILERDFRSVNHFLKQNPADAQKIPSAGAEGEGPKTYFLFRQQIQSGLIHQPGLFQGVVLLIRLDRVLGGRVVNSGLPDAQFFLKPIDGGRLTAVLEKHSWHMIRLKKTKENIA